MDSHMEDAAGTMLGEEPCPRPEQKTYSEDRGKAAFRCRRMPSPSAMSCETQLATGSRVLAHLGP